MTPHKVKCKHNKFWIISGGWMTWCYQCGAIRKMAHHPTKNECYPVGKWIKPTGPNGINPAMTHDEFGKRIKK